MAGWVLLPLLQPFSPASGWTQGLGEKREWRGKQPLPWLEAAGGQGWHHPLPIWLTFKTEACFVAFSEALWVSQARPL